MRSRHITLGFSAPRGGAFSEPLSLRGPSAPSVLRVRRVVLDQEFQQLLLLVLELQLGVLRKVLQLLEYRVVHSLNRRDLVFRRI